MRIFNLVHCLIIRVTNSDKNETWKKNEYLWISTLLSDGFSIMGNLTIN